ncbi:MAG: DNA polymerase I [Deltaproteobacteria bacterium]|nr:DNA polymerase I [Deltaproteobacteria bacterium]
MPDLFHHGEKAPRAAPVEPDVVVLVDGSSFLFRAYHALPRLTNSHGLSTHALRGYASMLLKTLSQHPAAYAAVVLDPRGPSFRAGLFPAYKANRPPTPPDLKEQFPYVEPLTEAMGVPVVRAEGFEADDVIATLAVRARDAGLRVLIASGDKDLMQLVGDGISMVDTMRDRTWDPAAVEEKFGVLPGALGEVLAIMGDSSDNIPGVRGIGPKGAAELVRSFGTLEEIYRHLERVEKPRIRQLLEESRELALLSRILVTLRTDVELPPGFAWLRPRGLDRTALLPLLEELEFRQLAEQVLPAGAPVEISREALPPVNVVTSRESLRELVAALAGAGTFAVDTETTSLRATEAELVGLSFCTAEDRIWYVPVGHRGAPQLPATVVREALAPLLGNPSLGKIGQHFKYDHVVLRGNGYPVAGLAFDTLIASSLLDPERGSHSLDALAAEHLGWTTVSYGEVTGRGGVQVGFQDVPVGDAARYSGEDAWVTWRLARLFGERLRGQPFEALFRDVELPVSELLARMELRGIGLDPKVLAGLSVDFRRRLAALERDVHAAAGRPFNVNSTQQLGDILFHRLGLPHKRKTKSGYSTDSAVLEELRGLHPLPDLVLEYRGVAKLQSTYVDALPRLLNPRTGRLHTSFSQTIAATGRLSSEKPNLQNIPVRSEDGRRIRRAFVPSPGYRFLSADYSQIELRLMAHLSGDSQLQEAFRRGEDIHTRTAGELFGVGASEVTSDMRALAKTLNFGVLYGMSGYRLARDFRMSQGEAAAFIDRYFARYPGVRAWKERTLEAARETGWVETLLGRRRRLPELGSSRHAERSQGERMAVNTPVQGSAADVVKIAMLGCVRGLAAAGLDAHVLLQVHDELIFEVPPDQLPGAREVVVRAMEGAVPSLAVPLTVDVGFGDDWAQVDEVRKG